MTPEELQELKARASAVTGAVSVLQGELMRLIAERIALLITNNDEQTRGGIKALQEILDLPAVLQSERDQMTTGLSNAPDPDFS